MEIRIHYSANVEILHNKENVIGNKDLDIDHLKVVQRNCRQIIDAK